MILVAAPPLKAGATALHGGRIARARSGLEANCSPETHTAAPLLHAATRSLARRAPATFQRSPV